MGLFGNKKNKKIAVKPEKDEKKVYTEIKVVPGKMAGSGTPLVTEMQEIKPETQSAVSDSVAENAISAEALQDETPEKKEQASAESYNTLRSHFLYGQDKNNL